MKKFIDGVKIIIPKSAYKGFIFKTLFTMKTNVTFKINPKRLDAKNLLKELKLFTVCLSEKVHFI